MASLKDGYARISNKILECIYSSDMTPMQKEIVLLVIRFTYGFGREMADLSYSYIAKGIGRPRRHVVENVNSLIEKAVLIQKHSSTINRLGINPDTDQWRVRFRGSDVGVTRGSDASVTRVVTAASLGSDASVTRGSDVGVTQEIQDKQRKDKERKDKQISAPRFGVVFRSLWNLYPKAKRDEAGKRFVTAAAAREVEENESKVRAALDAYLRSVSDPKYIQKASDFFGGNWKQYEPDEPERVAESAGKGGKFQ